MENNDIYLKTEYQESIIDTRYKNMLNFLEAHPELDSEEILKNVSDELYVEEFAQCRSNIVEWLPIQSDHRILEIHSGCGAVTQSLVQKAQNVSCIETSLTKSQINKIRCEAASGLNIYVGEFLDWSETLIDMRFDYIFVWGIKDQQTDTKALLSSLYGLLESSGKLIVAVDNKYGLKYWSGCRTKEYEELFSVLESDSDGFSLPRMKKLLNEINCKNYKIYYPYPDYKFAFSIYSDEYLPKVGELSKNDYVFDSERLVLFDQNKVFDNLVNDDLFRLFSNSYLFIIEGE